jgi:hypothetical protein
VCPDRLMRESVVTFCESCPNEPYRNFSYVIPKMRVHTSHFSVWKCLC